MKKYWIKDLTEKQGIHAPTREIADKLLSKFHELGLTWSTGFTYLEKDLWGINTSNTIYMPTKGCYSNALFYSVKDYEILTIDQLLDFYGEDNNGWTRVENGLMTESGDYLVYTEDHGIMYAIYSEKDEVFKAYSHHDYCFIEIYDVTHYQLHTQPKPPLY